MLPIFVKINTITNKQTIMTTTIVIIVIMIFNYSLMYNWYRVDNWSIEDVMENCGVLLACISTPYLLVHLLILASVSSEYDRFVQGRNSFVQTFESSGRVEYLYPELSEWNSALVIYKYNNTCVYLDQYTDDRFNSLEPIQ